MREDAGEPMNVPANPPKAHPVAETFRPEPREPSGLGFDPIAKLAQGRVMTAADAADDEAAPADDEQVLVLA